MSLLFSPLSVRDFTIKNRLWVSPMCQYSAVDGIPDDWHHVHLAQFASGGAGLVMTEATAVVPEGRIAPGDTGMWNDEQRDAWRPIVDAIHARGATAGMQLSHAGRKSSIWWPFSGRSGSIPIDEGGWPTEAPNSIAYDDEHRAPEAMSAQRIGDVVASFAAAARRAVDAGFDLIEVHAAHGYLLHQFLSPLTNRRTDDWGGSAERRARLVLDIVRAIRAEVGETVPVFVRFSATDSAPGGLQTADVATAAGWAREAGADLFDITTSGLVKNQQITVFPGYQVTHAAEIRQAIGAPTTAVGVITTGTQAEAILQAGDADAIFAAREFLRDPHFALRAAVELGEDPDGIWPPQYLRAYRPRTKTNSPVQVPVGSTA